LNLGPARASLAMMRGLFSPVLYLYGLLLLGLLPTSLSISSEGLQLNQWRVDMTSTLELPIRILTHNIRYATSSPFKGEKPWADRKQLLLNELLFNTRHNQESFICLQEVLHVQLADILSGLNKASDANTATGPEWAYIGVGREDGKEAGEYSPIIYHPAVWKLLRWETVWLSETPTKPSKGWDAASIRIVTIGVFKHYTSQKTILALNTHLDDQGSKSRSEAARIILDRINKYYAGQYGDVFSGVFLSGDFNSKETQEAYTALTADTSPLVDSQKLIDPAERYGNENTFTGFGYEGVPQKRIDYILLGPTNKTADGNENTGKDIALPWTPKGYAVLPNRFDDGVYNSDHRAVIADVALS
jgi:Metal-dependent hydrolase